MPKLLRLGPSPKLPKYLSRLPTNGLSRLAVGKAYRRVAVPQGEKLDIFPLAQRLTEKQIRKVRAHAVANKLHKLMFACDRALRGSERARVAVARWYLEGRIASR